MKKNYLNKALTFGILLLMPLFVTKAQIYNVNDNYHYYESQFGDNMFISAGAGINLFMIQNIEGVNNDRPITCVGSFAIGKWLTPYMGLQVELAGAPLKIFDTSTSPVGKKSIGYFSVYGDLLWNLSNTFWGYKESRFFSVIPFAGISYITTTKKNFNNEKPHAFPASAGLKLNFRLSHYIDCYLQNRYTFTTREFDGLQGGNFIEPIMTVTAGFSIKLGPKRFCKYNPIEEQSQIRYLNNKINILREENNFLRYQANVNPQTGPVIYAPCDLFTVVLFDVNSDKVSPEQQIHIYNVASWMKNNQDASVEIIGYADQATGSENINMDLSERRARAVANELMNTYQINPKRIKAIAKGSSEQPYPNHNDWNRVVFLFNK